MKNNRGLSGVITTLLLILVVMVGIGILWLAVNNIAKDSTKRFETLSNCVNVDFDSAYASCGKNLDGGNNGICDVVLSRTAKGGDISGLNIVFNSENYANNFIYKLNENVPALGYKNLKSINTGLQNVTSVQIIVYFNDENGKEQLCSSGKVISVE